MNKQKEVKLVTLRAITLYHFAKLCPSMKFDEAMPAMESLEKDIRVWVKNFLLTAEELDVKMKVSFIADNDKDKEGVN